MVASALAASMELLKSFNSSNENGIFPQSCTFFEIFWRAFACISSPVGLRSSSFLGFLGFLYLTNLCGRFSTAIF